MKYLDFLGLSYLVENIKNTFSKIGHTHTKSDITDLIIDSALSNSSTNAVENKVVQAAISIKANQSDLDTHVNNVENPHKIKLSQLGGGNSFRPSDSHI